MCPRGYQSAWADDIAVCPPYDYFENKFTLSLQVTALTPARYFLLTRSGDKTQTLQALRGYFTKM